MRKKTEELFDRLVRNMFENLSKSIDNIENDKKTAVIYYFSALELLFKARLLHEHWTLILSSLDTDDNEDIFNNFKNGNFKSIYFETAARRIRNLFHDLDNGYETNFKGIKEIRNKLIHFDYMTDKSSELTSSNITRSWYYFYKLLNEKWKTIFVNYQDQIDNINKQMHKYSNHFWESKKQALIKNKNKYKNNPQYRIIVVDGKPIICNICNTSFDSTENINLLNSVYDNTTYTIKTKCEICGNIDEIFLPRLYIINKNLSYVFKDKFDEYIKNNTWEKNSTVSKGFIEPLRNASDINIDFLNLEDANYEDYADNVYIESLDNNSSNLIIEDDKTFTLKSAYNIDLFYVLYSKIIFKLNLNEKNAKKADFGTLYNSIIGYDIEFSIDSDGM